MRDCPLKMQIFARKGEGGEEVRRESVYLLIQCDLFNESTKQSSAYSCSGGTLEKSMFKRRLRFKRIEFNYGVGLG
jgi:hypothetical protein